MSSDTRSWGLLVGVFAGPLAWSAHLLLSYALVPPACGLHGGLPLDLVTLATEALALLGVLLAARAYGRAGGDGARFLAAASLLWYGYFAYAILFEGLPALTLSPCV
jgi:hypothetical protein